MSTPTGLAITLYSEWYANALSLIIGKQAREDLISRVSGVIQAERDSIAELRHHYARLQLSLAKSKIETVEIPTGSPEHVASELVERWYAKRDAFGSVDVYDLVPPVAAAIQATYTAAARAMCSACAEDVRLLASTTPAFHQDGDRQYTCTAWPIWELLTEEAHDGTSAT